MLRPPDLEPNQSRPVLLAFALLMVGWPAFSWWVLGHRLPMRHTITVVAGCLVFIGWLYWRSPPWRREERDP